MTEPTPEARYVFSLSPQIADSLELVYFDSSVSEVSVADAGAVAPSPIAAQPAPAPLEPTAAPDTSNTTSCSVCAVGFDDRTTHYKSDFHRLNLKRSLRGQLPVGEDDFDRLLELQSIESLSGSESDDSDSEPERLDTIIERLSVAGPAANDVESTVSHLNTKSGYIYFRSTVLPQGKVFGVYKCLFSTSQLLHAPLEHLRSLGRPQPAKSALFMLGGGHFAGAIVSHAAKSIKGNPPHAKESPQEQAVDVVISKTFHRYTTRKKQGGSQSASDNARGKANSAGSSIRRYNEQALISEIRELLRSWKQALSECQFVFIRANGPLQRKIMVGYEDGCALQAGDDRIRSFPFTTKRATTSELKRAWVELTYLKVLDMPKEDTRQKARLQQQRDALDRLRQRQEHVQEATTPEQHHTTELVTILKRSKAPLLISYLKKHNLSVNMPLEPRTQYIRLPSLLHYASSHGLSHMVQILLVNLKADPTRRNEAQRTAAELSANAATRRAFQVARHLLGEEFCDWTAARVGAAKSREEFLQEEKEEQELLSAEKKRLIQAEMAKKTELELKKPTISGGGVVGSSIPLQTDLNALSDQQKMRLMREQRARAAEARLRGHRQ